MTALIDKAVPTQVAPAGHVLIVNSTSFGAVSLSLAWVNDGAFAFTTDQPPTRTVHIGGDWFQESRWGAAIAVSLPDGVHVLNATEVQVALHAAGVAFQHHTAVDVLAELFLIGLERLGVEEVRRIAADWRVTEVASSREKIPVALWRKEMRRVWGSRKQMDRACLAKCAVLDAVMANAKVAA
ncbi:hypothetical protein QRX60_11460 [Amycolatopsis mongoliensis]|uniref:Uncharacterized protein n=1 Tax=Amycolatopsis mongoliensis TaxID=715475 RepID=A0A9Y2NJW3_9PSEU|nr:hypothetical protein [Amycolatopsis sp. 4-36]WIY04424.1 hypothetical protein QRX60_11460 [Amycolatopsis sp. 4-36]